MKKLLLTCGVVALLSGASVYAQAADDPQIPENFTAGASPVGGVLNLPTFTFELADPANPLQVEVDFGPTSLFAIATEDKDVVTNELITINTYVDLNQIVDDTNADDFAEASAMGVQQNSDNRDFELGQAGTIGGPVGDGSGNNNTGLVSINQAAGNMNNQGTLVSAAIDSTVPPITPPPPHNPPPTPTPPTGTPATGGGFAHAQAEATQTNGAFATGEAGPNVVEAVDLISRTSDIDNSFDHDTGLVYANQATGNNNNQLNELA